MLGFKSITGLTNLQAGDGIPISSIPGDTGIGPSIAVLTALASGLPPSDGSISITLFPNGVATQFGTDPSGNITVQMTIFNNGDDKSFAVAVYGINITLPDGFWAQLIRSSVNSALGTRGFDIQFTTLEPTDFNPTLVDPPDNLADSNTSYDPIADEGNTDLTFSYDNSNAENPTALAVLRDGVFVGSVPWVNGTTSYAYTDTVFAPGTYTYTVKAYKYPDAISPASNSVPVTFGGTSPDINVTTDLSFSLDWLSTIVLIVEPSGIYTLVEGKTHDTLYTHTTPATVDVKIPRPFGASALIGE